MNTILFAAFILGAILGSFLNVCIYRMPLRLSVMSPARSFCPNCKRQLAAWENIPILSWFFLRGRCSGCKTPISFQYPLVEILSGLAGVATVLRFGLTPNGVVVFLLLLSLIVITFIDFEHKIIPDRISKPGATIGLLLGIVSQYTPYFRCSPEVFVCPVTQSAADSLFGYFAGAGFFQIMFWVYYAATKKEGLGGGDIKLLGMTGAIMGVSSVPTTIFMGSIFGAIVGVIWMYLSGKGRETEIPFGPWLALGAVLYLFADIPLFRF